MQLNTSEVRILVGAHCLCVSARSNFPLLNHPCASLTHFLRLVKCRDTSYMTAVTQSSNFVQLSSTQRAFPLLVRRGESLFLMHGFTPFAALQSKTCLEHLFGRHYKWMAGVIQVKEQVQPMGAWRTLQTDKAPNTWMNQIRWTSFPPCQMSTGTERRNHRSSFLIIPLQNVGLPAAWTCRRAAFSVSAVTRKKSTKWKAYRVLHSSVEEHELGYFSNIATHKLVMWHHKISSWSSEVPPADPSCWNFFSLRSGAPWRRTYRPCFLMPRSPPFTQELVTYGHVTVHEYASPALPIHCHRIFIVTF